MRWSRRDVVEVLLVVAVALLVLGAVLWSAARAGCAREASPRCARWASGAAAS